MGANLIMEKEFNIAGFTLKKQLGNQITKKPFSQVLLEGSPLTEHGTSSIYRSLKIMLSEVEVISATASKHSHLSSMLKVNVENKKMSDADFRAFVNSLL